MYVEKHDVCIVCKLIKLTKRQVYQTWRNGR